MLHAVCPSASHLLINKCQPRYATWRNKIIFPFSQPLPFFLCFSPKCDLWFDMQSMRQKRELFNLRNYITCTGSSFVAACNSVTDQSCGSLNRLHRAYQQLYGGGRGGGLAHLDQRGRHSMVVIWEYTCTMWASNRIFCCMPHTKHAS